MAEGMVVIPYQVRSYQTNVFQRGNRYDDECRNPLSSQVISNTRKERRDGRRNADGRNPLSSQVISNLDREGRPVFETVIGRNPLSSQVISNF